MPARKRSRVPAKADRAPRMSGIRWQEATALAVVLLACLLLRVAYLVQYKAQVPYYSGLIVDSQYYDEWAQRIVSGEGYGPKPFYLAPLYPYVLAFIYSLAGRSFGTVYALQIGLGTVNLLLVYAIGRRLFGHVPGLAAVAILALYPPLMFLESKLLSENLTVTLSLASVVLLLRAADRPAAWRYLVIGLVLGLNAVGRPATLLASVLVLAWLRWPGAHRHRGAVLPVLIGLLLPVLLVAGRNWLIGKDFALVSTNVGVTFAQGNNERTNGACTFVLPGFTGSIMDQQAEETAIASRELGRPLRPSQASAYWLRRGLTFVREHPGSFAMLVGRRLIWSVHDQESPCSYNLYLEKRLVPLLRWLPVPFALILGLAVFGFLRAKGPRAEVALVSLYALSGFAAPLLFFVTSRYRIPAVPFLGVFAGYGLVEAGRSVFAWNPRVLAVAVACLAGAFLPSFVPYPFPPVTAEAPVNLGVSYLVNGRPDEAIEQFKEALRIRPGFAAAHKNLGETYLRWGRLGDAEAEYRKATKLGNEDWSAHFGLGMTLAAQQRFSEAVPSFSRSLALNPANAKGHNNLAVALLMTGDFPGAWRQVRLCREDGGDCDPSFIQALTSVMPEPP